MDAIQFLTQEHEKAKRAFAEIEAASPGDRGPLWRRLEPELELHEQLEERYLYGPVARDAGGSDATLRSWESRHQAEVREAEGLIGKLGQREPSEAQWLTELRQLKAALEKHIGEEEHEIWPRIREAWDPAKLESAGRQMEQQHATGRAA
jgi:transposase-like protein